MYLIRDIRAKLEPVLGRSYSRKELNDFVVLCHALGVVAVRSRTRALRYLTRFHFANESDIAYECISDLFRQDEHGYILQLKAYFEGIDVDRARDEDLLAHLRRLIFSKVNFGLYRILNETDPALGKILRNIKLATQTLQNFTIVDRFGEQCLTPIACPTLEHLPAPELQDIEREFHRSTNRTEHVPGLLAVLSRYLREQHEARRIVPVMSIALAIKAFYEHQTESPVSHSDALDSIHPGDVCAIISDACKAVRRETSRKYLGVKKVTPEDFERYFTVIRQLLIDRIIERDGEAGSLFERLRGQVPEMTKEQYRVIHRAKLEYLARLTQTRAVTELRRQDGVPKRHNGAERDASTP